MIAYFDFREIYDTRAPSSVHELSWIYRGFENLHIVDWVSGLYNRAGTNIMPFVFPGLDIPGLAVPVFDPDFDQSWQQVTDQRCATLRRDRFDRSWVVAWSGGIDSTVIVSAILRNLPPADLENITIACNKFSIWENPRFYSTHIAPNFKVIDSSLLRSSWILHADSYLINGEPADRLFGQHPMIIDMARQDPDWPGRCVRRDADDLIDFMAHKSGTAGSQWATWFYERIMENIDSQPVPIETYRDFLWWIPFNLCWIDNKIRGARKGPWGQLRDVSAYFDRVIDWFDSDDYQLWSMVNNAAGEKYGQTISDNKLAAKRYIYEFDREPYYFKFKTKTASIDLVDPTSTVPWSVLFQDFTTTRFCHPGTNDLDAPMHDHLDPTFLESNGEIDNQKS